MYLYGASGHSKVIIDIIRAQGGVVEGLDCEFATAIHPSAIISPTSVIGEGTVIMQGAIIQTEVQTSKHCIINTKVSIDYECIIDDYVHIAPGCTISGK